MRYQQQIVPVLHFCRRLAAGFLLGYLVMLHAPVAAEDRDHARSMVITTRGIVATSQALASQAGAQVLARGGSAIDAAIAANAMLTVVEPMMCGLGGDLFALYYEAKTGAITGLNASGWAPRRLTAELLRQAGYSSMPEHGIHTVTVPGCVNGWEKLHRRFGRLPWKELFAPAIYQARHGFPVTELIQDAWRASELTLRRDDYGSSVYLPNGRAPRVGEIFRNPHLSHALSLIAQQGARVFYQGAIAQAILAKSARLGGVLEPADLAEFDSEWVDPISTTYRGWTIYELPPNSQGIAALEMLNIMETFPLHQLDPRSAEALHLKIEAQKLAYQDLQRYVADPRFAAVPTSTLLTKSHAAARAALIDAHRARCDYPPSSLLPSAGDTIFLAVVDRDGNIASLIQSVYLSFGSGIAVDGLGFHLHNRGALFTLEPAHANLLAPRKRPFHTIIPALMQKDSLTIGFGIMGGLNQAQAHAQFVSYLVDGGMNIQQALEAPRFTKLNFGGCNLLVESRFAPSTLDALQRRGHQLTRRGAYSAPFGGGQAVLHDARTGVHYGASSPRKDGAAIPEPEPWFASAPTSSRAPRSRQPRSSLPAAASKSAAP